MATVQILTIGDELLAGDIVDKNKAFLGQRCRELGLEVIEARTVRDRVPEIVAAIHASGADVCLTSGGLGPTTDDLTAIAVAQAAGVSTERRSDLVEALERRFGPWIESYRAKHGDEAARKLIATNLKQADLPVGADVLDNPHGSAPGFAVDVARADGTGTTWVASMPGVPREMRAMMTDQIEPRLRERFALQRVARRMYRTLGEGESAVQQRLAPVMAMLEDDPAFAGVFLHYRAHTPEVLLAFEGLPHAGGAGAREEVLARLDAPVLECLGRSVYGVGAADLPVRVVGALTRAGLTLATAESCTAGLVGHMITEVPGSSSAFVGGIVAYANRIKEAALGVPEAMLAEYGAVSEPVARAMAEGARAALGSDLAVSITGVAGPGGGSPAKPVGTVHIAVAAALRGPDGAGDPSRTTELKTTHVRLRLRGNRVTVRRSAAVWALKLVWDRLAEAGLASPGDPSTEDPPA